MKKNWKSLYLIFSSIIFILITSVCSLGFYNSSVSLKIEKYNFESIYVNTNFDFIIPGPSYDQVDDIEKGDYGIDKVTPYYSFNTSFKIGDSSVNGNIVLLDDYSKIEYTPYCSKRIISGSISENESYAIVDEIFSNRNKCYIGDKVQIKIDSNNFVFTVSAISESNTFYDGSIALIINKIDSKVIYDNNFKYSAAYVKAKDYEKCKIYLENEYKPLGRLKDRSYFDSEEAYNIHLNNFNSENWSKELTNMVENYKLLSLKYDNVDNKTITNTIFMSLVILISIFLFNVIAIFAPSEKRIFKELIIKKKGTINDIMSYNRRGNIYTIIISTFSLSVANVIVLFINDAFCKMNILLLLTIIPFVFIVIGFIINLFFSNFAIKRIYSRR